LHLRRVQADTVLGELEPFLNEGGEFADATALLSEHFLGVRGADDNVGDGGGDADFNAGVAFFCEFALEEFVEFGVEDTVGYKLAAFGAMLVLAEEVLGRGMVGTCIAPPWAAAMIGVYVRVSEAEDREGRWMLSSMMYQNWLVGLWYCTAALIGKYTNLIGAHLKSLVSSLSFVLSTFALILAKYAQNVAYTFYTTYRQWYLVEQSKRLSISFLVAMDKIRISKACQHLTRLNRMQTNKPGG